MADTGVSVDDFNQILADFTRVLSYQVVTKSTDPLTGSETTTYAVAGNKSMVFFKNENKYIWDKEGLLQVGDAYVLAPTATGIKRYDQFTVDGVTYYIENTIRRLVLGVTMMDYGICFQVTG
jgi:hypothetical protein